MRKKIIATLCILLIGAGTLGVVVVQAASPWAKEHKLSLFQMSANGDTSLEELIEAYTELKNAKNELRDMAESYGLDVPELNYEQKKNIIQTVRRERQQGGSWKDIRGIIVDMLIDYGFDLPGLSDEERQEIRQQLKTELEDNYGFVFIDLSPEQKAYIKQTIIQMKRQGADKEAIYEEVRMIYISYGGVIPQLNETQKEEIRQWIHTLIETEYDVDLVDLTPEQRENLRNKKEEIQQLAKNLKDLFRDANKVIRWRFIRYVHNDLKS
jgi:ribosomal protein L29